MDPKDYRTYGTYMTYEHQRPAACKPTAYPLQPQASSLRPLASSLSQYGDAGPHAGDSLTPVLVSWCRFLPSAARIDVDLVLARAVRGEDQMLAVGRPRRVLAVVGVVRQLEPVHALQVHRVDVERSLVLPHEGNAVALGDQEGETL